MKTSILSSKLLLTSAFCGFSLLFSFDGFSQTQKPQDNKAKPEDKPAVTAKEKAVQDWEEEQMQRGAPYVILDNGEKAFFLSDPNKTATADPSKNATPATMDKPKEAPKK